MKTNHQLKATNLFSAKENKSNLSHQPIFHDKNNRLTFGKINVRKQ